MLQLFSKSYIVRIWLYLTNDCGSSFFPLFQTNCFVVRLLACTANNNVIVRDQLFMVLYKAVCYRECESFKCYVRVSREVDLKY